MINPPVRTRLQQLIAAGLALHGLSAHAQLVIEDTLTGTSTSFDWVALKGACLTAGDGTGTIPKCVGLPYYGAATQVGGTTGRLPDANKSGALRLTNGAVDSGSGGTNQTGAVVSNFTFPTTEGIQVTWTSVSYGGNAYNGTGADGISFFLADGGKPAVAASGSTPATAATAPPTVGGLGGSLGYSCSNGNSQYDGVGYGYLGIGIDEYGNFSNPGDNTDTGPGFHAGRVAVRGAGYTSWAALSATYLADGVTLNPYAKYYKTGNQADAIHNTCKSGYAYNYSGGDIIDSTGKKISNGNKTNDKLAFNYPILKSLDVPANVSLANQQAINLPLRGNAIPIVFSLKITSDGLLDFSYSANNGGVTQTVAAGLDITAKNGPLPKSFRFGFSAGTGGGSNVHEITCFKATPDNVGNSSAGSNVQQSGQIVLGGVQVFLAYYHPVNWWGSITANTLTYNPTLNRLEASPNANWDGSCTLTGGACPAISKTSSISVQGPTSRTILSWNNLTGTNGAGIPFQIPSSSTAPGLTAAEQTALGSTTTVQNRVNYLRGDRSNEISNTGGTFRNRTSVLGDIVDSSPVFVGAPAFNYAGPWVDKTQTAVPSEGSTYTSFASGHAGRMNVVYVGANDGLLHAFRAGVVAADGSSISSNDGQELLAYMPGQVVNAIHPSTVAFNYSNPSYLHNFQVDGTAGTGDLYYNGAWHTWLVQGLGPGGHPGGPVNNLLSNGGTDPATGLLRVPDPVGALFALDITDPDTSFAESNAANLVVGEWNSSTIVCSTNGTCGSNMGQIAGSPLVRRLHDGGWGVIWGNGVNSATGRAGIFILHVSSSGAKDVQYIDAGAGPSNGIVEVTAADLDGDHITDFIYAGDVLGNLWRFDLSDPSSTVWSTAVKKLFTTASGQPITTAPVVSEVPAVTGGTGLPKLIVAFGTGQKLAITGASAEVYATGTQSLYGVWDASMSTWNATSTDEKYDFITTPTLPIAMNLLTAQTVTDSKGTDNATYRTVTATALCWQGATVCGSGNTQMGWKVDLPTRVTAGVSAYEQVIYNPRLIDDTFTLNTLIPQSTQALTCGVTPAAGFTMAVDIVNGSGDNAPYTDGTSYYSGVSQNGAGVVTNYNYNNQSYDGTETNDGSWVSKNRIKRLGPITRVTWTKVR